MRSIEDEARALQERFLALARHRSLRDPVAASCEELGLTSPQIHALLWLGHDGPLTMGELARRVAVTEKTVTGVVDRLERDGYLRRERDRLDRRIVRARATERGAHLGRLIEDGMHAQLVRLLGLLEPPERRAVQRIVGRLVLRLAAPQEKAPRSHAPPGKRRPRREARTPGPSRRGRREDT